jgi:hypothetical protein
MIAALAIAGCLATALGIVSALPAALTSARLFGWVGVFANAATFFWLFRFFRFL